MTEESFDEDSYMEKIIKSSQDELLSASIQYDAILKKENSYTHDYIELAAIRILKAESKMDTLLADYYFRHPTKLDALLKRITCGADLTNVEEYSSYFQEQVEDAYRTSNISFSSYINYVLDTI